VARRMHDLRCPVGFTGTRQASAPAPGCALGAGAARSACPTSPQSPHPEDPAMIGVIVAFCGRRAIRRSDWAMCKWARVAHGDAVTMQTELDMRDLLFPKEQVPASTPIPPARSGPFFLA
jgi:hypothetical protein